MINRMDFSEENIARIIAGIFAENGFSVSKQEMISPMYGKFSSEPVAGYWDILVQSNNVSYGVEICASMALEASSITIRNKAKRMRNLLAHCSIAYKPVLVVVGSIHIPTREFLKSEPIYRDIILLDIYNLLYMAERSPTYKDAFLAMLPYSVDALKPLRPEIALPTVNTVEYSEEEKCERYIERLEEWKPRGRNNFSEYEKLCTEILRYLFVDDLSLWYTQTQTYDGLFRFDLFCKITHGNNREFWKMIEQYFNSKYIVFEFKNYKERIKQHEVFTTVKYLYAQALRRVAILISVNGPDEHAQRAIRGVLREEGKLIITLSNNDLIEMLRKKQDGSDPSNYLSERLDMLLCSLEK